MPYLRQCPTGFPGQRNHKVQTRCGYRHFSRTLYPAGHRLSSVCFRGQPPSFRRPPAPARGGACYALRYLRKSRLKPMTTSPLFQELYGSETPFYWSQPPRVSPWLPTPTAAIQCHQMAGNEHTVFLVMLQKSLPPDRKCFIIARRHTRL